MFENPFALWSGLSVSTWGLVSFGLGGGVRKAAHERMGRGGTQQHEFLALLITAVLVSLVPASIMAGVSCVDERLNGYDRLDVGLMTFGAHYLGFVSGYWHHKSK